ncbi:AlbA family DNA-binding domain-containing protein [Nostoc sp.]|uniref:AlbA family DNA-binding domain-containing protein n=1 Tax=Nostoc sp. TaxID=1180 RepID=UPI002FF78426
MKDPWDWEEEDIELLIQSGVKESLTLDYKRCESLDKHNPNRKKDLSKDVSAFANSAGGVIVYGVIETNHLPTGIDSGYDPKDITREWLEQVINSTIQRRIDDVKIKQIELKKSNSGRVIYVVSIPQSKRAPHMAEDHIFYKRFNYQSIPMEEYEVRDVANRSEAPDLSLQFSLESNAVDIEFEEDKEFSKPINLNAIITNESIAPAMYYIACLFFDKQLIIIKDGSFTFQSEEIVQTGDMAFIANCYSRNYSVHIAMPVWQGVKFKICIPHFQIAVPKVNGDMSYALAWSADSPGMQQKHREAILTVSNNQAKILDV